MTTPTALPTEAPPVLSEGEAMEGYRAIVAAINAAYGTNVVAASGPVRQGDGDPAWYCHPVLVADFYMWDDTDPAPWAVVWEGGPPSWARYMPGGGRTGMGLTVPPVDVPPGIDVRTYCSFALSLSREDR